MSKPNEAVELGKIIVIIFFGLVLFILGLDTNNPISMVVGISILYWGGSQLRIYTQFDKKWEVRQKENRLKKIRKENKLRSFLSNSPERDDGKVPLAYYERQNSPIYSRHHENPRNSIIPTTKINVLNCCFQSFRFQREKCICGLDLNYFSEVNDLLPTNKSRFSKKLNRLLLNCCYQTAELNDLYCICGRALEYPSIIIE